MNPTQEQIDKLPKWAQQHLKAMSNRLARADRQLEALSSVEPTGVSWSSGNDLEKPLPRSAQVTFQTEDDCGRKKPIVCYLLKMAGGVVLNVEGDDDMIVMPRSSNLVYIKLD